ncbi:MAG: hypothetical protein HZC40_00585 [Chloroflexi bacterium]|nr:hypothetical protein [Chloroflexota bacterium]
MYKEDEDIADFLAYLQDRYSWPQYVRTTTGKNNHERIIRVMRKMRGTLPMTAAVQSLNPIVLKNIERSNIKLEAYHEITKELQAQGMQSYGELILCLPGETKASFMKSVEGLIDAGVKRISAHQLMLLHGAPLCNPESRERYGFKTRFRVVARNIGKYLDEPVAEIEEIVVETPTFTFAEYLETRVFHLLLTIFFYEGNLEEVFEFARQSGIKPFDLIVRMQTRLADAPAGFRQLIQDFIRESQEELFDTKEECIAWARHSFDDLVSGQVGGNLLSKYSMLGRFFVTQDALDFLETQIVAALKELPDAPQLEPAHTLVDYLKSVLLHAPFAETLAARPHWTTLWDVELWRREGYQKHLETYRFAEPQTFACVVEPKRKAVIENRLHTFGEHPAGMGKFTRTMFARDLHRTLVRVEQSAIVTG